MLFDDSTLLRKCKLSNKEQPIKYGILLLKFLVRVFQRPPRTPGSGAHRPCGCLKENSPHME